MEPEYLDPNSQGDEGATEYFSGRAWPELRAPDLSYHRAAMYMFTPAVHAYYLPAFMLACIEQPEVAGSVAEELLFHLASHSERFWALRIRALSPAQRNVLAEFVGSYYTGSFDREHVLRAIEGLRAPLMGTV